MTGDLTVAGAGSTGRSRAGASSVKRAVLAAARRPGLVLAVAYLAFILVCVVAPGLIAHRSPITGDVGNRLEPPSAEFWFGTDSLGRDVFSRVIYGSVTSVEAITIAVGASFVIGALIGLLAGFGGGALDVVLMRVVDIILSVPSLLLSLALIAILGSGLVNIAIAVGVAAIPSFARVLRADVLKVRGAVYVEAAHAGGARWYAILFRHVLPNSIGVAISVLVLEFGNAVLAVSALSFLGYGAPPPTPEWGSLVASGRDYLSTAWWLVTFPGIVVTCLVLASNRVAQELERRGAR